MEGGQMDSNITLFRNPILSRLSTERSFRPIHTKNDKKYQANIQLTETLRGLTREANTVGEVSGGNGVTYLAISF